MTNQVKRGHYADPCSVCGKTGHLSTAHRTDIPTHCKTCNIPLTPETWVLDAARRYKAAGAIVPISFCKNCKLKEAKHRYHSNLNFRLCAIHRNSKLGARRDGRDFKIGQTFLLRQYEKQEGLCYYSGLPMSLETGHSSISLDRIDSNQGYTEENLVLCLWIVNNAKRDMTKDNFIQLCKTIASRFA